MKLTLNQKLRSAHVKRYHIVRVQRDQNLAEHHFCVYLIAEEIRKNIIIKKEFPELWKHEVMTWALIHDLPEVVTGDFPPSVKRLINSLSNTDSDVIKLLEFSCDEEYRDIYLKYKNLPLPLFIVELADKLEAMRFLAIEGIGQHAEAVLHGIYISYLDTIQKCSDTFPEFRWDKVDDIFTECVVEHCRGERLKRMIHGMED